MSAKGICSFWTLGAETQRGSCGEDCGATGSLAAQEGDGSGVLCCSFPLGLQQDILFSSSILQHLKCLAPQNPPATPLPWTGGRWESLPTSCSGLGYVCARGRVGNLGRVRP